jgi:HEAT repeat protein
VRFGPNLGPEVPTLITIFEREQTEVRRACTEALRSAKVTPALVPTLIGFLKSPDLEVRSLAAELLGRIGPEAHAAIPALITVLNEPVRFHKNDQARTVPLDPAQSAARALGKMGPSREAIAALIAVISPAKFERLLAALPGIHEMGPPTVVPLVVWREIGRINAAVRGLSDVGPPAVAAVPALIASYNLALAHQLTLAQSAIPEALGQIAPNTAAAPEAVAALVRALDAKDRWLRPSALKALSRFGRDASVAIPKLQALQKDSDAGVQSAAASSLAALGVTAQPIAGTGQAN